MPTDRRILDEEVRALLREIAKQAAKAAAEATQRGEI